MPRVNSKGYVEAKQRTGVWKNWWLVKHNQGNTGYVVLSQVQFPPKYIGKKVKFLCQVIKEKRRPSKNLYELKQALKQRKP